MRKSIPIIVGLGAGSLAAAGAGAQTIGPALQLFTGHVEGQYTIAYSEPAIIASPLWGYQAIVMANKTRFRPSTGTSLALSAEYSPTIDGFHVLVITPLPFPQPDPYSDPSVGFQDPGVAASPITGDLFLSTSPGFALDTARWPFGTGTALQPSVEAVRGAGPTPPYNMQPWIGLKDKPFIAGGRWRPGYSGQNLQDTVYLAWTHFNSGFPLLIEGIRCCHSIDAGPAAGTTWAADEFDFGGPRVVDATDGPNGPVQSIGIGAYPVVLPNGRVVLGWMGGYLDAAHPTAADNTAFMTYTDGGGDVSSGGRRWRLAQQINHYGSPPEATLYGPPQTLPSNPNRVLLAGELSVSAAPYNNPASVSTNVVMVAFAARTEQNQGGDNSDIVVAQSQTGGAPNQQTGAPAFPPSQTAVITDAILHAAGVGTGETAEYHPSVVIDWYGGVNLLIVQTDLILPDAPAGPNRVWYLRWPSFENLLSGALPSRVENLTPDGFPAWSYFGPKYAGNDYHMMCLAGCDVLYLAYACPNAGGFWCVNVRVVNLSSCPYADVDGNGVVNGTDLNLFLSKYAAGDPVADRNYDNAVNAQDAVLFFSGYNP